jgi:hypothetical protein
MVIVEAITDGKETTVSDLNTAAYVEANITVVWAHQLSV